MIQIKHSTETDYPHTEELISELWQPVMKRMKKVKIKNEPAAIRADLIDQVSKLVKRPYPQMASLLYGYPADLIKDLFLQAKSFHPNPAARFWSLYKQSKLKWEPLTGIKNALALVDGLIASELFVFTFQNALSGGSKISMV